MSETPRSVAFCHHRIQGTKPFAVENAPGHTLFAVNPLVTEAPHIRCCLSVPLTTPEGYNLGSLCITGTEARSFIDKEAEVLAGSGRLVVSQLKLRMLARRDALTGALTRRAFEEALLAASKALATGAAMPSLLLFDVDHFTGVNDRWGHAAGDEVLRAVAGTLREELGPADRLVRLGGEEFPVLLAQRDRVAAFETAERQRLRLVVACLAVPAIGGKGASVSCGAAPWQLLQPEVPP